MLTALKIAIVEDHLDLRQLFVECLRGVGHDVAAFGCAEELDEHLDRDDVDLLVLDLNLPGENGYSVAERLRAAHPDLMILMLTARSTLADRVRGYASGTDLYLTKPVAPQELIAVVGGVVRRLGLQEERRQYTLNLLALRLNGRMGEVDLTLPEALLLKSLAQAPGRTLDYWRLQNLLRLDLSDKGKAALEVRISRLKKKLRSMGVPGPVIKAVWKEGYQLCLPLRIG